MTYAKAIRPASRPLSGRRGSILIEHFCRARRGRRERIIGWLFLASDHLDDGALIRHIRALDPRIGVVIRDYIAEPPPRKRANRAALLGLLKTQRRPTLMAPSGTFGGRHIPQWHRPSAHYAGVTSMSVHSEAQGIRARRGKADIVFVSPLHQTQSHPGSRPLGALRAHILARRTKRPAFALGGVNTQNIRTIAPYFVGFAAISALISAD